MSHLPERKEKDCLNCGTTVFGKYCHVCGQENLEPKESACPDCGGNLSKLGEDVSETLE